MGTRPTGRGGAAAREAPHEVRIIGGRWKRTKLAVPDLPGLRPTPDRVRETLFNWLGQDLAGWRCIDAYAGTGALGFEAASRGASSVLMVESEPELVRRLDAVRIKLAAEAVQVKRGDAISSLAGLPAQSVDLVFLDPPFASDVFDAAASAGARLLKAEGWLYLEAPRDFDAAWFQSRGLVLTRSLKAGAVHAHLARRTA